MLKLLSNGRMLMICISLIHAISHHSNRKKFFIEILFCKRFQICLINMSSYHRCMLIYPLEEFILLPFWTSLPLFVHLFLHLIQKVKFVFQLFSTAVRSFELKQSMSLFNCLRKRSWKMTTKLFKSWCRVTVESD